MPFSRRTAPELELGGMERLIVPLNVGTGTLAPRTASFSVTGRSILQIVAVAAEIGMRRHRHLNQHIAIAVRRCGRRRRGP